MMNADKIQERVMQISTQMNGLELEDGMNVMAILIDAACANAAGGNLAVYRKLVAVFCAKLQIFSAAEEASIMSETLQ